MRAQGSRRSGGTAKRERLEVRLALQSRSGTVPQTTSGPTLAQPRLGGLSNPLRRAGDGHRSDTR